ncbi:MAG TPA: GGDEF domain-containing protein [Candidatus Angelobacter sp.]|jgi:diguanylate cyclase (GGDEF)-like protein|nr:GGDEF domain-containing protein [Candidatus Angelobacter sp.]
MPDDIASGIAELKSRFTSANLTILESKRPWPERAATYLAFGKIGLQTDIVISDSFLSQLPKTEEYQEEAKSYASAVMGRLAVGSPQTFYCRSGVPVEIEIHWPWESSIVGDSLQSWLRVEVTNKVDGRVALCALPEMFAPFDNATPFAKVRSVINSVRTAIDREEVTFYERGKHPTSYQRVSREASQLASKPSAVEIEQFVAGKTYWLGFKAADTPRYAWIADPWDGGYLGGVTPKEMMQAAYVLQARNLVELDKSLLYARPSGKLLTQGPSALNLAGSVQERKKLSLSTVPGKEQMVRDVNSAIEQKSELALVVIDLDNFKTVNDRKGHPEGDACLERTIQAIGRALGRKGTLYRWGGDEFSVMLADFSTEEAHATAERIRRVVEEAKPGKDIPVTTSIGVSGTDRIEKVSASELFEAADKAMYASKHGGKNRVTSWPVRED